jgi:glycosyltransferase involved in cell wall biosynthesis
MGGSACWGRLPRKRILEQLTRTTFFPLLSDFEGLPLSLVEAMAAGCVPIVAEMPSGIPELVTSGHDGVIMSGRDYDAWAALLVELWEDGARLTAMSRNARKTVREAFTIEKIGGEFDRLLCRIADDITSGRYRRPDPLHWGRGRSPSGDVLPSPNLFYPPTFAQYPGLT